MVKKLIGGSLNFIIYYYTANPVLGKSLCSDWFFLGQDFAVWTVSMKTVQSVWNQNSEKKSVNNVILHIETIRRK